jgi:Flp pilus assembly protein TadD
VRTIKIEVRPLGGDSFKITVDASMPTVGEAKAEIARSQGTAQVRQELYRVAERADGLAVREDDAEPELLDDEGMVLEQGDVVAMAVKVSGSCDVLKPCPTSHHV